MFICENERVTTMAEEVTSPEKLPKAPPVLPDDEVLYELADLFRVFGDSTRIKILYALHDDELCVQDIANAVQLSQSAVSHQLRVLKDTKLVRFRRDGKTVYYALDDDHVRSILSTVNDDCSQEERLKNFPYCVNIKTIWEVINS